MLTGRINIIHYIQSFIVPGISGQEERFRFSIYLFVLVEYLCDCSSKTRTKNFLNFILILHTVNYWNWLDTLPPFKSSTAVKT